MKLRRVHETLSVHDSDITESSFANTRLVKATFDDVNLQSSSFTNVNLTDVTFVDVNLTNVSIRNANLTGMTIEGVPIHDLLHAHHECDRNGGASESIGDELPLMTPFQAGAVLYAKNVALVQAFYEAVLGFDVENVENDHVVLSSPAFQLVVLKTPEHIAASIEIEDPPRRRSEAPMKLAFEVASIATARTLARVHGGELLPTEREWDFRGSRVCDGHDPEGNVIQLRQLRAEL